MKHTWVTVAQSMLCGSDSFQQHRCVLLSPQILRALISYKGEQVLLFRKNILVSSNTWNITSQEIHHLSKDHLKVQLRRVLAINVSDFSLSEGAPFLSSVTIGLAPHHRTGHQEKMLTPNCLTFIKALKLVRKPAVTPRFLDHLQKGHSSQS